MTGRPARRRGLSMKSIVLRFRIVVRGGVIGGSIVVEFRRGKRLYLHMRCHLVQSTFGLLNGICWIWVVEYLRLGLRGHGQGRLGAQSWPPRIHISGA